MKPEDRKRLLREMIFYRRFEDRCFEAYMERKVGGFLHLYSGQEAVATGVLEMARCGHDYVITGYRDHVHAIKAGASPREVMAELYGKETGSSRGRGGSMHIFDVKNRFMGGYALVGGPFPLAAGIAKGIQMRGGDEISICFLGDAANNQGTFHESLNMAKLWNLPVLYVCENNLYGASTHISLAMKSQDIADRAAAYGMPGRVVDGMDVLAVYESMMAAVDRARSGSGPTLLEYKTYRFMGHSRGDPGRYRGRQEVAEWRQRDPIKLFRHRLMNEYGVVEERIAAIERSCGDEVEAAVKAAQEAPEPRPEEVTRFVFAGPKVNDG
jgi:pyruvate dehydrogenase E1 component alpha subunit